MANVIIPSADVRRRLLRMAKLSGPNRSGLEAMYKQWGTRYSAEARRVYRTNASGGGDWAPLQPATIARRRAGKGAKAKQTIGGLRRAGLMQARRATTDRQGRSAVKKLKQAARAGGLARILIDTGALFNTLSLGAPGNLFEYINGGVRFGVSGKAQRKDSKITLGKLATMHSTGAGNLPARPILVKPSDLSQQTQQGMRSDLQVFMRSIGQKVRFQ